MLVIFSKNNPFLTLYINITFFSFHRSINGCQFKSLSISLDLTSYDLPVSNYNSYPKQDYNSQNVEVLSRCKLKLTFVGEQTSSYVEASQYPWIPSMQNYLDYFSKQAVHLVLTPSVLYSLTRFIFVSPNLISGSPFILSNRCLEPTIIYSVFSLFKFNLTSLIDVPFVVRPSIVGKHASCGGS